MTPVILAGGAGTRLWPLSRAGEPKQYHTLFGDRSLLQNTVLRAREVAGQGPIVIVTTAQQRFLALEHLRGIGQLENCQLLLEPTGRNTAPAITAVALWLLQKGVDEPMLIMPSDHILEVDRGQRQSYDRATELAQQGYLVTFSIVPSAPEISYGYIRRGQSLGEDCYRVSQFVEKPDRTTAEHYLQSGEYSWNSGMFTFLPSVYREQISQYAPDILAASEKALSGIKAEGQLHFLPDLPYRDCPSVSVDYALMEHSTQAATVLFDGFWSDVGSWGSLWNMAQDKDSEGNSCHGDVVTDRAYNNYLHSSSRLLAVSGVSDLVVAETEDSVLVVPKHNSEQVSQLVSQLQTLGRTEVEAHRQINKPWGYYRNLGRGEGFLTKLLMVRPGERLSLQRHRHRSENWVVVSGTATVQLGSEQRELTAGEHIFIAPQSWHRLENRGTEELLLVEVQLGEELVEEDIERAEDDYGR